LNVRGFSGIKDSFKHYVAEELLKDENQYETRSHGKQDANKRVKFTKLPPVLQIQLKRFEYDREIGSMTKINDRFEIDEMIDLDRLLKFDDSFDFEVPNIYHLHSIVMHRGFVFAGHYYTYIK
jgi:ubiquitin carboxyl-terminal hydrolase 7